MKNWTQLRKEQVYQTVQTGKNSFWRILKINDYFCLRGLKEKLRKTENAKKLESEFEDFCKIREFEECQNEQLYENKL